MNTCISKLVVNNIKLYQDRGEWNDKCKDEKPNKGPKEDANPAGRKTRRSPPTKRTTSGQAETETQGKTDNPAEDEAGDREEAKLTGAGGRPKSQGRQRQPGTPLRTRSQQRINK